jgi:hypothetical protein
MFGLLKGAQALEFSLAFFTLSEPIWVCDLATGKQIDFFYQLAHDFECFWFFAAYAMCGKKEKNYREAKTKSWAYMNALNEFFEI